MLTQDSVTSFHVSFNGWVGKSGIMVMGGLEWWWCRIVGDGFGLGKPLSMITLVFEQKLARSKNQSEPGPAQQSNDVLVHLSHTTPLIFPTGVLRK